MTALVQVRVDKELKEQADALFNDLGLDTTTALRMFLKAAVREQKIPFSLRKPKKDPFDNPKNIAEIQKSIKSLEEGKGISFTYEEFEEFADAVENATSQEELDTLNARAQKGWSNV